MPCESFRRLLESVESSPIAFDACVKHTKVVQGVHADASSSRIHRALFVAPDHDQLNGAIGGITMQCPKHRVVFEHSRDDSDLSTRSSLRVELRGSRHESQG